VYLLDLFCCVPGHRSPGFVPVGTLHSHSPHQHLNRQLPDCHAVAVCTSQLAYFPQATKQLDAMAYFAIALCIPLETHAYSPAAPSK
jgi:hypothetical protein